MYPFRQAPLSPARVGRALLLAAACLVAVPSLAPARELVRVRISRFTGVEPFAVDSLANPELFTLDDSIESAVLVVTNPFGQDKTPQAPGTFLANVTPIPPATEAGTIDLIVTPKDNTAIAPDQIRFNTQAAVASNPSALSLTWSRDGFATELALAPLEGPKTLVVALAAPASEKQLVLRWTASNVLGQNGGGAAGFSTTDIVLSEGGGCPAAPAAGCLESLKATTAFAVGPEPRPRGGGPLKEQADTLFGRKNSIDWSWTRGTASTDDIGDPTTTTGYTFCFYDDDFLRTAIELPPGGTCGSKPCWKASKRGNVTYVDRSGRVDGVLRASLKPGAGKASVKIKAVGPQVPLPLPISQSVDVTVQLHRTDGPGCWSATYSFPARTNTETTFLDTLAPFDE